MTITKRVQNELVQAVAPADTKLLQTLRKSSTVQPSKTKARSAAERNKGKAWTCDEHERFLVALEKFPSGPWKAIADFVGTKDSRQTMTHAQKYRQKHERQQRGLRKKNKAKKATQRAVVADTVASLQPQIDVAMVEATDFSVFEAPPPTLTKQQSDSPRSADEAVNIDPFAPVVADESLFSLALDAGATWLNGKSDSDLMEIFAEYNEPVTDAAWPQMWSTNSLEEMVASCSQLDFLGES
ncbi:hypothetical protein F442_16191 [Phytophthora nicotianae P10297]|uniref:Myb-like domain-containing protein n=4 Tax=Phytophthora nicotianae TaxID=4792 RepID=W2PTK8_PHYN3|nr:hypothetical protein PPTG_16368 [Phytophthora nicotianae INRA-310]ETI37791.1 hypothetical protein F443_16339 [Phytophthora nicotianae P1569]ETL31433.1 hypothetical protein L916_15787 [Phytophthora nicotianae]ETP35717.1 hypothetical protein F442_16191 [Phytophthora nicotianae P10297]KUF77274.1 Transcription factor MYB1R1 [Phytophthora nicotianae]ETM37831.1 hypothetical protein L914_15736 [Phytophthora nicotianae]